MEYSKIIAITGLPGLYELISSKSDGGIVRSLDDKTTRFVSSRVHQFSHLESIEIYTQKHNENLVTILKAMEASKEKLPDEKDPAALKAYFESVYPELDHTRVYPSDLKKMIRWFSVLQANKVDIKLSEPVEEAVAEEVTEERAEPKPAKKAKEKEAAKEKEMVKEPEAKKAVKKETAAKAEKTEKSTKKEPAKKTATKAKEEKKPAAKGKTPAKKKAK